MEWILKIVVQFVFLEMETDPEHNFGRGNSKIFPIFKKFFADTHKNWGKMAFSQFAWRRNGKIFERTLGMNFRQRLHKLGYRLQGASYPSSFSVPNT